MRNRSVTIGGIDFDWQIVLVIIICTVIPMLDWYGHSITNTKAYDRIIWYFVIPALTIMLLFREPLSDYGFQIGNWRKTFSTTLGVTNDEPWFTNSANSDMCAG